MSANPSKPRNAAGPSSPVGAGGAGNPGNLAGKYSTVLPKDLENMRLKAEATGDSGTMEDIASEQGLRSRMSSYKKGGKVFSASKRADGCAIKGKTRGKMI